ncbi:OpgC family protein [Rhodoplanes sp. Z2-YC6860]|uniref:OpgC family protein n=1 Tax=Rhodoplanes sp. Z2-YC6860 TaxID=674703 RepID=UPI00078CAA44|nr:OpgC domain-containing protein [Rhodoplanes sp. Z2-YC6860]AMN44848.1 cyclic beta glucan succinyl transferase [Rhodoplanes sp. Z2-YC6860]
MSGPARSVVAKDRGTDQRNKRPPNPVDFWRGLALVFIFINHIPGTYYTRFTHADYSISDSADLFVFLAGWALRYVVGPPERQQSAWYLMLRLEGRAFTLYAAQILITMMAIAMLAGTALWTDNPLLLEWLNAAAVFQDPIATHVGLALLTHQLGYFNILPLYVVLMMIAPFFVLIDRYATPLLLPVSLGIYCIALGFSITIPTWPVEGEWFFNPFAWQLIFVLGFVIARKDSDIGSFARRNIFVLRIVAVPIVVFGAYVTVAFWWPDPTALPNPKLFFILSKSYESPPRVIQFLALIALFSVTYPTIARYAPGLVRFLSMLGRNSLYVFCVGSVLSLAGQIVRFLHRGNFYSDTAVIFCGILLMALTAWLPEWRESIKARSSARSVLSS